MDNPPSNYNPNDSVLSGGIDSSTPITMVQGGGGVLNNYNETASVLEGGIDSSVPITQIQGGGGVSDIQIIENYNLLDTPQYEKFVKTYSTNGSITIALKKLEDIFKKKYTEKTLHYRKTATYIESNTLNSTNSTNLIQIKFVPSTTKSLIILSPVKEPKDFVQQLMFLITNKYLRISSKKEFIIEQNIFVISLAPFDTNSELLKYFYYKVKLSNLYSYYCVNDPYVFILRKEIEDKKGILIAKSDFKFLNPMKNDELQPTDYALIDDDGINTMKYKGDPSKEYTIFNKITDGEDPESPIISNYSFTLKSNIAVIDLIDEDVQRIKVDINGEAYRIRVPLTPNENLDKVFGAWVSKKYEKDEMNLINKLGLNNIEGFNIAKFLLHVSYFKCFDDKSILAKSECSYLKKELQKVYLYSLKKRYNKVNRINGLDNRIIKSYVCDVLDERTDKENIMCRVTYKEYMKTKETKVSIDKKHISIIKSTNPEDIKIIDEAVETEFRKQK